MPMRADDSYRCCSGATSVGVFCVLIICFLPKFYMAEGVFLTK